jgi:uncharacterized membrane protein YccC
MTFRGNFATIWFHFGDPATVVARMLQIIRQFTWRDGLFAVKTFVAAMIALFIAFRLNLSQPSWSVTTVYIVSQPFAGMVLAKSLYRVLGTLIGAVMSLVFVALFSNSPELFCLALALWIGAGATVSVYLRDAPQAYVGMLAGYSAAIIGLPAALAPGSAFDFAVARCLEIMLGIACGTLMHHLVFPRRAGDALRKALDATLPNMARWVGDALRGQEGEAKGLIDRRQIIASVTSLDSLRVFAALDTPAIRAVDGMVRLFEGRLLSLLALLVSIYDRMALLARSRPSTAEALKPLLARAAAHIAASAEARWTSPEEAAHDAELESEIAARLPPIETLRSDPDAFLVRSILLRLRDALTAWNEAIWARTHIAAGTYPRGTEPAPTFQPYRDVTFAVIGGAISACAVLVSSAFWILTAWPSGTLAVTFAGIMCAIMGARDDPVAAAAAFLKMSVVGAVIGGVYLFLVLPPLTTFPALVVALAPFYLFCGLFLTAPAAAPFIMPMIFIGGGLMGLSNAMSYDFAEFLNSFAGYVVGIGMGAATLGLLRPLRTEWIVRRLTRGILADLAHVAATTAPEPRATFASRMFDRINALLMRLDPMNAEQRAVMQGSLASLRVGHNVLTLRTHRALLPKDAAAAVEETLTTLAAQFAGVMRRRRGLPVLPKLRAARERMLALDRAAPLVTVAEALYSIEATLAQHPVFFGLPPPAQPAASSQPVTA